MHFSFIVLHIEEKNAEWHSSGTMQSSTPTDMTTPDEYVFAAVEPQSLQTRVSD